ncbi:hypothetical protein ACRC7T_08410 [Segnochrobactraceae bacterium EtOH-i3]
MTQAQNSTEPHARQSLSEEFNIRRSHYQSAMAAAISILDRILPSKVIITVSSRIKDFDSFYEKANKNNGDEVKYTHPFDQIHDIVGIRIIVIAKRHIKEVCDTIRNTIYVFEEEDKAAKLLEEGQLGYESYHLLCKLGSNRSALREYSGLCDQPFEIQVRTALQHAWAENEHRIQYKKSKHPELQKRFLRLAAAVSSADKEFDRIYEINEQIHRDAEAAAAEIPEENIEIDTDNKTENIESLSIISKQFGKKPSELLAENRYSEAIQVYNRFIDAQPTQVTHYVGRAKARVLAGDIEGGLNDLEMAKKISAGHPAIRVLQSFFDNIINNSHRTTSLTPQ